MALPRLLNLVDLTVATIVAVAIFLPAREMFASNAFKDDEFSIALAEARTMAKPGDGVAIESFARKLGDADMKDWAIESTMRLADRAKDSPTRWRALIAASVALVDKIDIVPALDYATRALAACEMTRERGDTASCPRFEQVRMELYQQYLEGGVKSGIDPRIDPEGFRDAGDRALHYIRLAPRHDVEPVQKGSGTSLDAGMR